MTVSARDLFEAELARRGMGFTSGRWPGRYEIRAGGRQVLVSLDNLARQLTGGDQDAERVAWFTDQVLAATTPAGLTADGLYWLLEPSDYAEKAEHWAAVSPQLDRVLAHVSEDGAVIRWVSGRHLEAMSLTAGEAAGRAWANLDLALRRAAISTMDIEGATLAVFAARLPSKASLLLAPSLQEVIGPVTGWPVLAIVPDRDFVYVWAAHHRDLIPRLGAVVIREHARAPYPLTTEVLQISDTIRAIGTYA